MTLQETVDQKVVFPQRDSSLAVKGPVSVSQEADPSSLHQAQDT